MKPIYTRHPLLWSGFFVFFLLVNGCERSKLSLVPPDEGLRLEILEVGVTEVWLKVKVATANAGQELRLYRDGTPVLTRPLPRDTTVMADSLLPNHSYRFRAELWVGNDNLYTSPPVTLTTMDTTRHNFTWQKFTFGGQGGSSTLFDVAIINENDIWAVGEMYVYDSTGTPVLYNAVHYNGSKWELKRITVEFRGNMIKPPLYSVFAFSSTDIWFSSGVPINGDGKNWKQYHLFDMGILSQNDGSLKQIWGNSSNDIYFVGNKGTIAHYNNGSWQKINSGTSLNVNDIWGDFNKETGKWEILAVASNIFSSPDRAILSIDPATRKVTQLSSQPIPYTLKGVWFNSNKQYYVSGDGIFQKHRLSDNNWKNKPLDITRYFTENIRGNDINDIMVVGDFGELLHFNGVNWKSLRNETGIKDGIYYSIDIKGNTVVTVGLFGQKAILLMGKR